MPIFVYYNIHMFLRYLYFDCIYYKKIKLKYPVFFFSKTYSITQELNGYILILHFKSLSI